MLAHHTNVLFRNEVGAGFLNVTATAGVGDAGKGTTAAWGDYENDLGFYFYDMGEPMSLLQYVGGRFRNATEAAGVGGGGGNIVRWGTMFFDFDNDG